jgi:hypothetical protein
MILNIIRILVCCYGNDDVVKKLHGENRFSMVRLMALINGCAIRLKKSPLEEIDVQSGHLLEEKIVFVSLFILFVEEKIFG